MREFEFLTDEVRLTHRGERHYYGASGSQGGEAGACSESIILRANGDEETVPSKLLTTMNRGDRLLLKTAGGGGYGSPGSRSATAIADDVANGKVCSAAAASVYANDD